jgi:hypothetical protein
MTNRGQPKKHPLLLKTPRSIKIPEWLWQWLDQQEESRAVIIEEALKKVYKVKEPDKVKLDQKDLFK